MAFRTMKGGAGTHDKSEGHTKQYMERSANNLVTKLQERDVTIVYQEKFNDRTQWNMKPTFMQTSR
jgi:hypothetical protein